MSCNLIHLKRTETFILKPTADAWTFLFSVLKPTAAMQAYLCPDVDQLDVCEAQTSVLPIS